MGAPSATDDILDRPTVHVHVVQIPDTGYTTYAYIFTSEQPSLVATWRHMLFELYHAVW